MLTASRAQPLPARKHCSDCGRWRSFLDFRPRGWRHDGTVRYVASECDYCHKVRQRKAYARLSEAAKRERHKQSLAWHNRKRRLDAILEEAEARRSALPPIKPDPTTYAVQQGAFRARPDRKGDTTSEDPFQDYLFNAFKSLKMELPNVVRPVRGMDPLLEGFMDPEYQCKHERLPGDRSPECGCWGDEWEWYERRNPVR